MGQSERLKTRGETPRQLADAGADGLIESKLRTPAARHEHIVRRSLLSSLSDEADAKLILVSATAGFGKTTLLAQWARDAGRPMAWVSLDADDRHAPRFWAYVIAALEQAAPGVTGRAGDAIRAGAPIIREVLPNLLNSLSTSPGPLVLVLDDFHEASSLAVEDSMTFFLAHTPSTLQVALATRRDPLIPLARWKARGDIAEFRQSALRFSVSEARDWMTTRGLNLSESSVRQLVESTEGWPAALYLRSLGLSSMDQDAELHLDDPQPRIITEYINEEALRSWPPEVRNLMQCASPLSRFSAQLIDHVLNTNDAGEWLRDLEHRNLMVTPLDDRGEWYRLHALLAEVLRAELHATQPDLEEQILLGAARWHLAHGDHADAINYALESGDVDFAADLINSTSHHFTDIGHDGVVRSFIKRIPEELVSNDPRLLVTRAWIAALRGDWALVESSLNTAVSLDPLMPLPDGMPSVEAAAATLRGVFPYKGIEPMRRSAATALRVIPEGHTMRVYGELGLAYADQLEGRVEKARKRLRELRFRIIQAPLLAAVSASLALYDVDEGNLDDAQAELDTAESIIDRSASHAATLSSLTSTARGEVMMAIGDTEEGMKWLEKGAALPGRWHSADHLESLVRLARNKAIVGDVEEAAAISAEVRAICLNWGDAGESYLARLPRTGLRLTQVRGPAGALLSVAELRVLDLLATTHLTQPDIAVQLHLSLNTVKSHVRSIYIKLGVASREEAIQAAGIEALPRQR
ncbi:MAG: LuxR C-terminal-related transcriptional regulator [Actinomycetota bacterium]